MTNSATQQLEHLRMASRKANGLMQSPRRLTHLPTGQPPHNFTVKPPKWAAREFGIFSLTPPTKKPAKHKRTLGETCQP